MSSKFGTISVDQFVASPPSTVWRLLTEPELHARWWVATDMSPVVGHEFHLDMPGRGHVWCKIIEVELERRLAYTFNDEWTILWRLEPEGRGTRLFLDHSGFDLGNKRALDAFNRMGPGWRQQVLPRLADLATQLT